MKTCGNCKYSETDKLWEYSQVICFNRKKHATEHQGTYKLKNQKGCKYWKPKGEEMPKEQIKGTIVETSLREIISRLLSEYVAGLKRNGDKIFVTGDEFSSTADVTQCIKDIELVFTDEKTEKKSIIDEISPEKLTEYTTVMIELHTWLKENRETYKSDTLGYEAVTFCIGLLSKLQMGAAK